MTRKEELQVIVLHLRMQVSINAQKVAKKNSFDEEYFKLSRKVSKISDELLVYNDELEEIISKEN